MPKPSLILAAAACALLGGCVSPKFSQPDRTGIEQLLLSTAADHALQGVAIPQVEGRKVHVDFTYLESYDSPYVKGSIRALLSENGALLTDDRTQAEIIVEARSGALGIDPSRSFFGIPSVPIVVPGAGTVETPEASLYKARKRKSVAKIALLAYDSEGRNVFSTEPLVGKAFFSNYTFLLLIDINFTDIPEREDY